MYVTVFSILCPLSSFSFFLICLVAIIFLMNKDVYKVSIKVQRVQYIIDKK